MSEKFDSRGRVRLVSVLSQNPGNMRSILGLPELTKDISVSGTESSPYDFPVKPLLVNGDLFSVAKGLS